MADTENVYEQTQLMIHGSRTLITKEGNVFPNFHRCFGYGSFTDPVEDAKCVEFVPNESNRELRERLNLHGVVFGGHQTGNPVFCMHLKIDKFGRTSDGYVTCVIEEAGPTGFKGPNGWHHLRGDVAYKQSNGYLNAPSTWICAGFSYGITVWAQLFVNGEPGSEVTLFYKPGPKTDGRGGYNWGQDPGTYYLQEPIEVSAAIPTSATANNLHVDLGIFMLSMCRCSQAGKKRLVFADEITAYFPTEPEGYIWRRFGTPEEEAELARKYGYTAPDPNVYKPGWHLIRPFFYQPNSSGTRRWKSVEEVSE